MSRLTVISIYIAHPKKIRQGGSLGYTSIYLLFIETNTLPGSKLAYVTWWVCSNIHASNKNTTFDHHKAKNRSF